VSGRDGGGWLGVTEATARLGVKPATLYAYVSRGLLTRRRAADGHSLFDPAEITRLAERGRPRHAPAGLVIESAITVLGDDRPYYRGHDALVLAERCELEEIAEWLWTGPGTRPGAEPPGEPEPPGGPATGDAAGPGRSADWRPVPAAVSAGRLAQAALPAGVLPLDRLQVITAALAASDPLRLSLDPAAVADAGRRLIAGMVTCLPPATGRPAHPTATEPDHATAPGQPTHATGPARPGPDHPAQPAHPTATGPARPGADRDGQAPPGSTRPVGGAPPGTGPAAPPLSARLWSRLTSRPAEPGLVDAVRSALVLLADHELAASTLAARVAASVRADPYATVAAALGVVGGAWHGGASLGVQSMLAEAGEPGEASQVMGRRLRRGERIPGFGHRIYRGGDGRAGALLDRVRAAAPENPRLAVAEAMLAEARRRRLPEVNVDFALGVLAAVAEMVTGAGEVIFVVARTAGWLAHAMEEYARPTPLRLRASYTGPLP
jgi:citrate synthase